MDQDFVCQECGHEYEELGDGKCYVCGGNIIPIDEVGKDEEPEYPEELMEEEGKTDENEAPLPGERDWQEPEEV